MTKQLKSIKTDSQLQRLSCPTGQRRIEVADAGCAGLRIRVTAGGVKSFVWYSTTNRKRTVTTLGQYPNLSLTSARKKLQSLKSMRKATGVAPIDKTINGVICMYLSIDDAQLAAAGWTKELRTEAAKADTLADVRVPEKIVASLALHVSPAIGSVKARDLSAAHIIDMVEGLSGEPARLALLYANRLLKWAVVKQHHTGVARNPCADVDAKTLGVTRASGEGRGRLPTREEIGALLDLIGDDTPVDLAIRLSLLLGVRSGEIHKAEWIGVDFMRRLWTVSGECRKSGTTITYPLSDEAVRLLQRLHAITGETGLVMGGTKQQVTGRRLKRLQEVTPDGGARRWDTSRERVNLHDFRRLCSTNWHGRKEFDADVIEFQLGHSLGGPKVRRVYDKAQWLHERRALLDDWAERLEQPRKHLLSHEEIESGVTDLTEAVA